MPSPYGNNRGAAVYYQNAGEGLQYVYNWSGMPHPSSGPAPASLGGVPVSQTQKYPGITSEIPVGPEYWSINDGWYPYEGMGAIQLSRNERTWLTILIAAGIGWYAWTKVK